MSGVKSFANRKCFAPRVQPRASVVGRAAAVEVAPPKPKVTGPKLDRPYYGPHRVSEEGIERIVDMLRKGDLFRYGGSDEGSLQVSAVHSSHTPPLTQSESQLACKHLQLPMNLL